MWIRLDMYMGKPSYTLSRYVVFRSDGYVVITDSLRDAKRSLERKYIGSFGRYLEQYGNVLWIPLRGSSKKIMKEISGIYTLDQVFDVLRKIFKTRDPITRYLKIIYFNSKEVVKRKIERERNRPRLDPPPVKILEFDSVSSILLLYHIFKTRSKLFFQFRRYIVGEFKNFIGIYSDDGYIYLSIRKDRSAEEIVGYIIESMEPYEIRHIMRMINEVLKASCEYLRSIFGNDSVCGSIMRKLKEIKFLLEYLSDDLSQTSF